jgi:hypothetical protein
MLFVEMLTKVNGNQIDIDGLIENYSYRAITTAPKESVSSFKSSVFGVGSKTHSLRPSEAYRYRNIYHPLNER